MPQSTYDFAMRLMSRNVDPGTIVHFLQVEAAK